MSRKTTLARVGLFGAILFASVGARGEIFALPKSDKLVTFEVTVPGLKGTKEIERDGKKVEVLAPTKIRISTREGSLFQIQDKERTYWFGFIATLGKSGKVTLSQFGIASPAPKEHNATGPFLQQEIKLGQVATFLGSKGKTDITVRYLGEKNGSFPDAPPFLGEWDNNDPRQMDSLRLIYGDPESAICCVGCGPIRVCADSVDIPGCGSCNGHGGASPI